MQESLYELVVHIGNKPTGSCTYKFGIANDLTYLA